MDAFIRGMGPTSGANVQNVGQQAFKAAGPVETRMTKRIGEAASMMRNVPSGRQAGMTSDVAGVHGSLERFVKNNPKSPEAKAWGHIVNRLRPTARRFQNNPRQLYSIYRDMRDARRDLAIKGDKAAATRLKDLGYEQRILEAMETRWPDMARGREAYARLAERYRDPLRRGPLGQLTGTKDNAQAFKLLEDALVAPGNLTPTQTRYTIQQLHRVSPDLARDFSQTYLANAWDKSMTDLFSGPQPRSGPKMGVGVAGSPNARANMRIVLKEVARQNGVPLDRYADGFQTLMDVFKRAGSFGHPGSATGRRTAVRSELEGAQDQGFLEMARNLRTYIGGEIGQRRVARNAEYIMDIMTAPDSVAQIAELGRRGVKYPAATKTKRAAALATYFLAQAQSGRDAEEEAANAEQ
jgi:hypothetical protein